MERYVIKRLLMLIPILLGVTFIVFGILSLTPGTPGRIILGPMEEQASVDALNHELGFDRPFLIRYVDYVFNAVQGDFGLTYRTRLPVFDEIFTNFPITLRLAASGIILAALIGIPLGILAAVKQYSFIDSFSTVASLLLAAIPGFWLGLMLILVFSLELGWLPPFGATTFKHYILPVITLSLPSSGAFLRLTRTTMLETIRQDYVRTARSKGVPEGIVIWKHALKNAILPVITILGSYFGIMLGGTILLETVFSMNGLGSFMLTAIRMKDIPQVMGATIFLASLFCIIILITDLICAFIDPRVRAIYLKK